MLMMAAERCIAGPDRRAGLFGALLLLLFPDVAGASFDVVGVYQSKVKSFEAVYFIEQDEQWRRDRRVVEMFGEGDWLTFGEEGEIAAGSVGLLVNVRPDDRSQVQLSLFNIYNDGPLGSSDSRLREALHGARLTAGEWVEASLGGYWLISENSAQGSLFLELNAPFLFSKSSYVIGKDLSGAESQLKRFDLRFSYDQLMFVDDIDAGLVRYNLGGEPNWMLAAKVTRIGHPQFKFASMDVRYSLTTSELAWFRGGLDLLYQAEQDYNLTRRGHFGTSFGLRVFYTHASASGFQIFDLRPTTDETVSGWEVTALFQIPAKWFWTVLAMVGAGAAQSSDLYTDQQKQQMMEDASRMMAATIEEPRDVWFARITFTVSQNAPETYALLGAPEERMRYFFSLSFIY
jgi:hypothetical protein